MKRFFEIWKIVRFIIVAMLLWPFFMPMIIIARAHCKYVVIAKTKSGRKNLIRYYIAWLILEPMVLMYDLTVGYGYIAYVYYIENMHSFKEILDKYDEYSTKWIERNFN